MRKPLRFASACLALLSLDAMAEEPIHGIWIREGGHQEKLEFFDCEGKLCARGVLPLPDGSPPPLILRHAAKTKANHWKGELFNPENGKTYSGSITLDNPKQLTLTGCLFAFLCQSETWNKAPKDGTPPPSAPKSSVPASAQKSPAPASAHPAPLPAQKNVAPVPATKNPSPAH